MKKGQRRQQVKLSKLKNNEIYEIRKLRDEKMSQQSIADKFHVSQSCISRLLLNQTWRHVN